ncbi:uncharacterized protein RCC_08944 [Ramularia collo-cygni]|uniref:Uncharacterized protein n=1 Tax=Ramularia collo-cygni TaxID=112498 RepID=A0A2D3V5G8_9PEZI|nr:uncharacterized protein RCC_08944 [Ramularia collo-cygni]CZT23233.1 uncharacterized protein RCC_08944 [Ramularia collo-cygni]
MATDNATDLDKLCVSAFDSEYLDDKTLAMSQHQEAINGLKQLQKSSDDKQRKKAAKKQVKFHTARLQLLQELGNGSILKVLPTAKSAQQELLVGSTALSMDQWRIKLYQEAYTADPNAQIPADAIHLFTKPIPPYSPTVPLTPPSVFEIHYSSEMNGLNGGNFFYVKAKDPTTHQTFYVLKLLKQRGMQMTEARLYRAAGFTSNGASLVTISQIDTRQLGGCSPSSIGRNLTLDNSFGAVEEKMDRQMKPHWNPRRFTYGGRNFVWKRREGSLAGVGPQDLYETTRVWPDPSSKTGKFLDDVLPDCYSWGEMKARITKLCIINIRGGIDQAFMEYILASQLTKLIVELHGHD